MPKNAVKQVMYKIISCGPYLQHCRELNLRKQRIVVLMYHEIAEDDYEVEAWTVVKKKEFIKQMLYLKEHFEVISLGRAIDILDRPYRGSKPLAVVTFDDGYSGNFSVGLPIFKSLNIPVTIFVATKGIQDGSVFWFDKVVNALQNREKVRIDARHLSLGEYVFNETRGAENWKEIDCFLRKLKELNPEARETVVESLIEEMTGASKENRQMLGPLSVEHLRELARCELVTIGSHSHCHNILTQLREREIEESIRTSRNLLESWCQKPIRFFSYPNGDYDERIMEILETLNFTCAVTTERGLWKPGINLLAIPRVGIGRYDSIDYFKTRLVQA